MTPSVLPTWLILAAVLAAAIWTAQLARRRPDRRRLPLRLTATWTALAALALLASPPSCHLRSTRLEAVLITPGATRAELEALLPQLPTGTPVFRLSENRGLSDGFRNATELPDPASLVRNYPEVSALHVLGHGLRPDQLSDLPTLQLIAHPNRLPMGVSWLDAPQQLPRGHRFRVQGRWTGLSGGDLRVVLTDPGGRQESARLEPHPGTANPGEAGFSVELTAAVEGPQLYQLHLQDGEEVIGEERLPLFVTPAAQLRFLILQSAPSFELRQLKSWLAQQGHAVAVRSRVSRERYRREFLNHDPNNDPVPLTRFSLQDWTGFQMVVADLGTLTSLSPGERGALKTAISESGLGLLVLADRPLNEYRRASSRQDFFLAFQIRAYATLDQTLIEPWLPGATQPPRMANVPWELIPGRALPLLRDRQDRVLAAMLPRGSGRVGLTVLNQTFTWQQQGSGYAYASLWTTLLDPLVKATGNLVLLPRQPEAFVDLPFQLQLRSQSLPSPAVVRSPGGDTTPLPWLQHELDPARWQSTFWPRETGWHTVSQDGAPEARFYVHADSEWSVLQSALNSLATRQAQHPSPTLDPRPPREVNRPWPAWTLFAVFLVASTGLWIESKL